MILDDITAFTDYLKRFEPFEYETFSEKYLAYLRCFDGSSVFTVANSGARQKELQKINNTFKHPAVMNPLVMVVPLLEYCPDNGRCYDNFSGSGTTGIVCVSLGKGIKFTGRERNQDFRDLAMADFANWYRANTPAAQVIELNCNKMKVAA